MIVQRVRSLKRLSLILMSALLFMFWMVSTPSASPPLQPHLAGPPPTMMNIQGVVKVGGAPYSGTGYFKFAVVDSGTGNGTINYWANDGTASGEPGAAVALTVNTGLFNVLLGDTSLGGSMQSIEYTVFSETNTWLRIWFSQTAGGPFEALEPNQRIVSVAYALRAAYADDPGPGVIGGSYNSTLPSTPGEVFYCGFFGMGLRTDPSLTEVVLPVGGTASNLYVHLGESNYNAPSQGWAFTLFRDGAPTSLTCQMLGRDRDCSDTTHTETFVAGSLIAMEISVASDGYVIGQALSFSIQYR